MTNTLDIEQIDNEEWNKILRSMPKGRLNFKGIFLNKILTAFLRHRHRPLESRYGIWISTL